MGQGKGFSLVEVLVASLIIMVGVTGYVTLQSEYVLADRNLNLRHIAMQLGEDKLNDLSFFEQLTAGPIDKRSYNNITTNTGGDIVAGPKNVRLSNSTIDTHVFEVNWVVDDFYYIDSNFDDIPDVWVTKGSSLLPKLIPKISNLKSIVINVDWLNVGSIKQRIVINSYIIPLPPSNSFHVLYREPSALASPK